MKQIAFWLRVLGILLVILGILPVLNVAPQGLHYFTSMPGILFVTVGGVLNDINIHKKDK